MRNWKILILNIAIVMNTSFAAPQIIDKVAAIVNDGIILESEVDDLMQSIQLNINQADWQFQDNTILRNQVLERLILDQILLQIGQKIGVEVTEKQLNQMINNIANQNNTTTDQMRNYLAHDNIKYSFYLDQVRKELLIAEVLNNEVRRRVTILPQEIDALTKQMDNQNDANTELNLSHILIGLPENPTLDQVIKAERQAQSIANQARTGKDFKKLAIIYNLANQEILKDEQMGWRRIQELPFIFSQPLSTTKKDDVVGPIRSKIGFHILKVNDLRSQRKKIFITEVHARHILLKKSPIVTDDQVREKLQQITADIKSGKTSFSNAAKEFSQDPDSINQGGDLGWVEINTYDPSFQNALMTLKKGQISDPVRSSFGWHVIQLIDIRNIDKTVAVQKDRAYHMLFNRKFSEEKAKWIQEQRASAYVKIMSN